MHASVFTELSLVLAVAAIVALIMRLIKQPLIIGYIITGVLVGPLVFNFTKSPEIFETFASIGIALLLFIVGLGLNPKVIKEVGKVATITGFIQIGLTIFFGYLAGKFLGFTATESVFVGAALAFSSTIVILKILSDKKDTNRLYGKITIGIMLVQDVVAALALLIVASKTQDSGISLGPFLVLFFKGALLAVPLYYISTRVLPKLKNLVAGNQEFLFLFAIAWGFTIATLFDVAGFSLEIGALFAGVCWANLPYSQEVAARLRPLRDFFIIVFFISLGTGLTLEAISNSLGLIVFGILISVILKPLVVLTVVGILGYTKQTSFRTAITTSQISEFSLILIVLGQKQGLVNDDIVGGMIVIAFISIAISTYLIIYSDKLFSYLEQYLSIFERKNIKGKQDKKTSYDFVLIGYQRGGHEFIKVFKQLKKSYIVVDYDPDVIDMLERKEINYQYGDVTDIEMLDEVGIDSAKLVVATITDHDANQFLLSFMAQHNPKAVIICHADSAEQAHELYDLGASYVMIPHYIGSEKISAFIKRNGLSKAEFKKFREKHLEYLEEHNRQSEHDNKQHRHIGHAILENIGVASRNTHND